MIIDGKYVLEVGSLVKIYGKNKFNTLGSRCLLCVGFADGDRAILAGVYNGGRRFTIVEQIGKRKVHIKYDRFFYIPLDCLMEYEEQTRNGKGMVERVRQQHTKMIRKINSKEIRERKFTRDNYNLENAGWNANHPYRG